MIRRVGEAMQRNYDRLDAFLRERERDIYPETDAEPHKQITEQVIGLLAREGYIRKGSIVLDIGPGFQFAKGEFEKHGCHWSSVDAPESDQSFLPMQEGDVDLVWARHVLEHSVMPYFTLTEYYRVLCPGGLCYIEVPAPDTEAQHETNPNHYSIMGSNMWFSLMLRAGFKVEKTWSFGISVPQNSGGEPIKDTYFSFLLRKEKHV